MLRSHLFPRGWHRRRAFWTEGGATRNRNAAHSSGKNRSEGEPLVPMRRHNFLEHYAPLGDAVGDVGVPIAAGVEADRFADNDPIASRSGSRDEERIDRCLSHECQNKWAVWYFRLAAEKRRGDMRDIALYAVALDRDDLAVPQCL